MNIFGMRYLEEDLYRPFDHSILDEMELLNIIEPTHILIDISGLKPDEEAR